MRLSKNKAFDCQNRSLVVAMAKFIGGDTESTIDGVFVDELEPLLRSTLHGVDFHGALADVKLGSFTPFKAITAIAAKALFKDWKARGALAVLKAPIELRDSDLLISSKHSRVFVESVNKEILGLISGISQKALCELELKPKIFS